MFASKFKTVLLTSILALSAAAAQADVITFEGIVPTGDFAFYTPGVKSVPLPGYTLTATGREFSVYVIDSEARAGGPDKDSYATNGTALLEATQNGSVTLMSSSSSLFSVNSIDLANYYYDGESGFNATAILTGTFADGTTISNEYVLSNNNVVSTNDFTTELLSGYTNLTSFTIAASGAALDVDNIVINQVAATAAVPEPASLAILGLGLVGIGAVRRRKSA